MNHGTEDGEMWRQHKEEEKKRKEMKRNSNSYALKEEAEAIGWTITKRTDYHYSFFKDSYRVDYYPTSG